MRRGQPEDSYYIHKKTGWTDTNIRDFRIRVRKHNIWVRYAKDKGLEYDRKMEKGSAIHNLYKFFSLGRPPQMIIIENNLNIKRRTELLGKLRNYHKKFNIPPPDFSKYPLSKLDLFLKNLFKSEIKETKNKNYFLRTMHVNM